MNTDQVIAEWRCPCGARGTLLEGATDEDRAAFWEDSSWHDTCEPGELTPADVLPDATALAALIPDDIHVAVAIEDAERIIARARGVDGYFGLHDQLADLEGVVAYSVLIGRGIAWARSWATRVALVRDAAPTTEERNEAREAVPA